MNLLHHRLKVAKRLTNSFVQYAEDLIPEVKPQTPVAKMTDEIFQQLLIDAKAQPAKYYKDLNFPKLLECARKFLIFVCEMDNHYDGCLGVFYILTMLKVNRLYEEGKYNDFSEFVEKFLGKTLISIEKLQR